MDPLPPRRVRQTTDIAHVTIECCQFTVEPAPLFDRRNPPLGTKHVQKVPDSDAQLVAQLANRVRAIARWHMVIQEPSLRSEEHTSELQSLMRISYAVFCLKKKNNNKQTIKLL